MMHLRFSELSPYARKVRVVAHELGIADHLRLVPTTLRVDDPDFWKLNPLGKIPTLLNDHGLAYFDSPVICEYLDAKFGGNKLLPASGAERWEALTIAALADGMTDAGMLARQETLRPEPLRSAENHDFQFGKVHRSLARLEGILSQQSQPPFDFGWIAVACSLSWLVLRFGSEEILRRRSALARWHETVALRPSMLATAPTAHG